MGSHGAKPVRSISRYVGNQTHGSEVRTRRVVAALVAIVRGPGVPHSARQGRRGPTVGAKDGGKGINWRNSPVAPR
jgi:hypothetical protein